MKKFIILFCFLCIYNTENFATTESEIDFEIYYDEKDGVKGNPRSPVKTPDASLDDHTLYIYACEGCVLQLVQNDEVVYSTIITSDIVELPESLSGTYELQIIRGNYCFWADIEL